MGRSNIEDAKVYNPELIKGVRFGAGVQTLAGVYTMDRDMPTVQALDPGGATRVVLLPPEEEGLVFILVNRADGIEDLTVKEDSNTTTIGTVSQNEAAWLVCVGGVWTIMVGTTT